jgi:predicted DsbA family dithiol-disulfide isomerase
LQWTAFPLHPEIPPEGISLERLFAGRPVDIPGMLARFEQTAQSLGLPFGPRRMSYNSRLAQEAAKWAESQGKADTFHDAVFRAYFADGKNLHAFETLTAAAEALGLAGDDLAESLRLRTYREAVDRDWQRSRELRVTAVPTFRLNGAVLVGAQPYEKLAALLADQGVPARRP